MHHRLRGPAAVATLGLLIIPLAACGSSDSSSVSSAGGSPGGDGSSEITVLAAASLTETFTDLADEFEKAHPGVTVRTAFDSSATLAQQAVEGAPADVLATADTRTMASATQVVGQRARIFATNTMVMVVPSNNPAQITGFADLNDPSKRLDYVACVQTAPCGGIWASLAKDNDVTRTPASLEVDVKSTLMKVTSDEADAGFVYATDAVAAGDAVKTFPIPDSAKEISVYAIATLDQSKDPQLAQQFAELVLSASGKQVLKDAGFGDGLIRLAG